MNYITRRWPHTIFFSLLLALLFLTIFISNKHSFSSETLENRPRQLISDWYILNNNTGCYSPTYLPSNYKTAPGETLVLMRHLDSSFNNKSLLFFTKNTSVRVLIDDTEIYHFGENTATMPFGSSPGNKWNIVPLGNFSDNSTLTIEFCSPYFQFSGNINYIMIGSDSSIFSYLSVRNIIASFLCIILFLSGFATIVYSRISSQRTNKYPLVHIGFFLLFVATLGILSSNLCNTISTDSYMIHIIYCLLDLILPISFITVLYYLGYISKYAKYVYIILCTICLFAIFLQILNIVDFMYTIQLYKLLTMFTLIIIYYYNRTTHQHEIDKVANKSFQAISYPIFTYAIYVIAEYINPYTQYVVILQLGVVIFFSIFCYIHIKQIITLFENNVQNETTAQLAYIDNLTGLYNRRAFDEDLKKLEHTKQAAIITIIDLNNFKKINDTLGHHYGDVALKSVSSELSVFELQYNERCYRIGGDEFCIICTELSLQNVISVCDEINSRLKTLPGIPKEIHLSMAYGYKKYEPHSYDSIEATLRLADDMMYKNKMSIKSTQPL